MIYPAPSYLTGLVTEATQEILSEVQRNYGDNTTAFKFKQRFKGLTQTWLDEFDEYGGTIWGTDTNGNKILLFDQSKHGYNGVMELSEEEDLDTTKSIDFKQSSEIIIAFQYNGDEDEYLEDGTSNFQQDYFGWVILYRKDDSELGELLSYECS
jgi:hypothetical protein